MDLLKRAIALNVMSLVGLRDMLQDGGGNEFAMTPAEVATLDDLRGDVARLLHVFQTAPDEPAILAWRAETADFLTTHPGLAIVDRARSRV